MQCNGCMDVAWAAIWEKAAARNLVFFSGKVAPAGDGRYLVCPAGAGWIVLTCDWFCTVGVAARCSVRVCVCVSSSVPKSFSPLTADSKLFKIPITIFIGTLLIPLHLLFIAGGTRTFGGSCANEDTHLRL